jgi:hypothetical protein
VEYPAGQGPKTRVSYLRVGAGSVDNPVDRVEDVDEE